MTSLNVEILILAVSSLAQLLASGVAFYLMRYSGTHRYAWFCISFALFLMAERRVEPLYYAVTQGQTSPSLNSGVGLAISLLMVIGVVGVRRLFIRLMTQEKELQQLATTDSLTGLPNRREIFAQGRREVARHLRFERPLALMMVDIDDFKRVNDALGHQQGDEVLKDVAEACRASLRTLDAFGRIGGDEFMAILPEADPAQAQAVGERLRLAVSDWFARKAQWISVSVGIAMLEASDGTKNAAEALVAMQVRADTALYRAKAAGRNRIVVAASTEVFSSDGGVAPRPEGEAGAGE